VTWTTLFRDGSGGFGDYRRQTEDRYHFSLGIDARIPGQLRLCPPSFRVGLAGHRDTPVGAVVWKDNNGLAFFAPVGGYLIRCGHTSTVEDLTGTAAATGVALHTDNASVQYLYVTYGSAAHIERRSAAGVFSQDDDMHFYQLEPLDDGRLVGVDTTQYKIAICVAGTDPFTAANWGSSIIVGRPQHKITALAHIGDYIIVIKEDGVYAYNPVNATFVNLTPSIAPHTNNGKGSMSVGGLGVLVLLANGDVLLVDQGLQVRSVGPANDAQPGRDTPMGRITAICHAGEWGYAYTEPFLGKTRGAGDTGDYGLGTTVIVDNDGTLTDYSAVACDNNPNTVLELTGLGGAASADYLYVGANVPFEGIYIEMQTLNTTASSGITTIQYWNGSAWVTPDISGTDLTYRSVPTCSFARSGYVGWPKWSATAGVAFTNLMGKSALTGISTKERYWMRFRFLTTAAVA